LRDGRARIGLIGALIGASGVWAGFASRARAPEPGLRLAASSRIQTLDPALAEDRESVAQVARLYETLLARGADGRLAPALAEALPEMGRDGRTLTIRLRPGALFGDDPCFRGTGGRGRELTAEDVVYSWRRVADPRTASPGWDLLDGWIEGLNAWRAAVGSAPASAAGLDPERAIAGLRAVDRYTVQLRLTRPARSFLPRLASFALAVVPREAVDRYGSEFGRHPVGSGPFRLEDYDPSSRILYARKVGADPGALPAAGGPSGRLPKRLLVRVLPEEKARLQALAEGEVDAAELLAPFAPPPGVRRVAEAAPLVEGESLNLVDPALGGEGIRAAVLALLGAAGTPGAPAALIRARALLNPPAPPGMAAPPRVAAPSALEYLAVDDAAGRARAEQLAPLFEQLGVPLRVTYLPSGELAERTRAGRGQIRQWPRRWPDPDALVAFRRALRESGATAPGLAVLLERAETASVVASGPGASAAPRGSVGSARAAAASFARALREAGAWLPGASRPLQAAFGGRVLASHPEAGGPSAANGWRIVAKP
jgi:hypothetical protein